MPSNGLSGYPAESIEVMNIFNSRLPNTYELQALIGIIDEGTVTRAADRLGVSQSTLSHTLDKMRSSFDDPLFVRVGNRMEPTPFARKLHAPAMKVLQILELEVGKLKEFQPRLTTSIFRVGANEIGAIALAPKLAAHLSRMTPRARLETVHVQPENIRAVLDNDEVDVAVGFFPETESSVPKLHLYDTSVVCIARTDHPKVGDSITLTELAKTPFVDSKLMTPVRAMALAAAGEHIRQPFMYCAPNHLPAIPSIVANSDLIAIVPIELFEMFGAAFKLKQVKIDAQIPPIGVYLYWHKRNAEDPAINFLREAIVSLL